MGDFKLTTVEEFEAATDRLLETGAKVGADAWHSASQVLGLKAGAATPGS